MPELPGASARKEKLPGPDANRLVEAREHARCQLNSLPMLLRQLSNTPEYPVIISAELQALAKTVDERNTG